MVNRNSDNIFNRGWVMDRAWGRDRNGTMYDGEALLLAMLLRVKKEKNRTDAQEKELQEIYSKKK